MLYPQFGRNGRYLFLVVILGTAIILPICQRTVVFSGNTADLKLLQLRGLTAVIVQKQRLHSKLCFRWQCRFLSFSLNRIKYF